jgi:hypothetical protein
MATNADLVEVAATGAVYMSTVGASAPTNATVAWSTAWKELGFLSEDGFTENPLLTSDNIKAWQSGAIVRKVITESGHEFSFTAIETNLNTLELFYPGSTVVGASTTIKLPVATPKALGFDVVDGSKKVRIVVPKCQISERGEVSYVNGSPIAYPFTFAVEPNASNELATKYFDPVLT